MSDTIENKIILRGKTWSNSTWNWKYRIKLFNPFASMRLSRDVMSFVWCFKRDILCVFSLKNKYRSKKSLMVEYIFIFPIDTYYLTIKLIKRNKKYSNYLFTLIAKLKKLWAAYNSENVLTCLNFVTRKHEIRRKIPGNSRDKFCRVEIL